MAAKKSKAVPFHEFCETVIGLKLYPGQSVVAKVAFGDYDPDELDGEERELALELLGGIAKVPKSARRIVVLRLGRGSGKTTLCSAFGIYEGLTADISRCGPGSIPVVIVVAPDKSTAKLSIRMVREMLESNPHLKALVEAATDESVTLRRPDGRRVMIEAFAASKGGSSVRGRDVIAFLLDEAEFFQSDQTGGFAVNDRDIYRAIIPRLLPNGKGMLVSTPWPSETLMGELFEKNFGHPVTATAVLAPTNLVRRGDTQIEALVQEEMTRDPDNARREFFCELVGTTSGTFFDDVALRAAVDKTGTFPIPRNFMWPIAIGCDFGFKHDSSTLVACQFDGKYYRISQLAEISPKKGQPLKPSEVVASFAAIAKSYGVSGVVTDGHYREALKEHLQAHGLVLWDAPEGITGKNDVYARTRAVLHEGLLVLPDSSRLQQQMRSIVARPTAGGLLSIRAPRKTGLGHGDLVSALVLAVHRLAYAQATKKEEEYERGTLEWQNRQMLKARAYDERMMAKSLAAEEKMVRFRR